MSVPTSQTSEVSSSSSLSYRYEIVMGNKIRVHYIYTTPFGYERMTGSTTYLMDEVDFNFDSNEKFVSVSPKPTAPFRLMRQNGCLPDDYEVTTGSTCKKIALTPGMILCQRLTRTSETTEDEDDHSSSMTHLYEIVMGNKIRVHYIYTTPFGYERITGSTTYLMDEVDFNFDSNGKFVSVSPKPTTPYRLMRQNGNVPDDYELKVNIGSEYKKISLTPGMILFQHTIL
jgi:hypothetical protein